MTQDQCIEIARAAAVACIERHDYMRKHLTRERRGLDGFIALGNELIRAANYDRWIAALDGIQSGTDGGQA